MATLLSIEGIHKTFEAGTVNGNHVLKGFLDLQEKKGFISVIGELGINLDKHLGRKSSRG